jgi:hypothetical protein
MRRDHEKYLTLIDTLTLLHQHQRELKSAEHEGERIEYVEVTLSDIEVANNLAHEALGRSLDEFSPQTRRLLRSRPLGSSAAHRLYERALRLDGGLGVLRGHRPRPQDRHPPVYRLVRGEDAARAQRHHQGDLGAVSAAFILLPKGRWQAHGLEFPARVSGALPGDSHQDQIGPFGVVACGTDDDRAHRGPEIQDLMARQHRAAYPFRRPRTRRLMALCQSSLAI